MRNSPPEASLKRTLGRNTMFGMGERVFRMLVKLALMGFIVDRISVEGYGIWDLVVSAVGFMSLGVAGVGSAFQKYVAEATSTGEFARASQRLSIGASMMLTVGLAILLPCALFPARVASLMGVPGQFLGEFNLSIQLLAVTLIFTNFGNVYGSIVMGAQRIDLARIVDLICTLIEAAFNVALLLLGYGLLGLVVSYAVMEIARTVMYYALSRRLLPEIHVSPRYVSRAELRETLRFAGGYQLFSYAQVAYGAMVPVIINRFFGPEVNGVCAVCRRLVGYPMIIAESALLPLLSGATLLYARGQYDRFQQLFVRVLRFTLVVLASALAFMSVFGNTAYAMIANHVHPLALGCMALLCVATLLSALSRISVAMYRSAGGASRDILFTILKAAVFLLGCALLRGSFEARVYGMLAVFAAAELAGLLYMQWTIRQVIPLRSLGVMAWETARTLGPSLALAFLCQPVLWLPLPFEVSLRFASLLQLAVAGSLFTLLGVALVMLSNFLTHEERDVLRSLIPLFRRRNSPMG